MHELSYDRYVNCRKGAKPVTQQINDAHIEQISQREIERCEDREVVKIIFDTVRHLAKQNIPFRGHNEKSDSENRGNFLEELIFLSKYC